jgi:hypothetical protein
MRALFLATFFVLTPVIAAADAPGARAAYVERRGLIEADTQCRLFSANIRAALQVGAAQARGALLRAGWTNTQVRDLEQAAVAAARSRQCGDQRTLTAAEDARRAFTTWANAGAMTFPGWQRNWLADRVVDDEGWRLSQAIDAPVAATFGVRDHNSGQSLVLVIPLARGVNAPNSARLVMRDPARGDVREVALTHRIAQGLEAGLATPNETESTPSTRTIERLSGGRSQAVFTFPDEAFASMLALDPRESMEIRIETSRSVQRLLIEVGDVAAARAFLTIR